MRNRILSTLASLLLLVIIASTSSCTFNTVERKQPPRHKQRIVWVSGVRYRQVYYIDNVTNNVIIVNQIKESNKKPKHHKNKGKHKGN
ncbi:MAG: hypothetical protein CVU50_07855 [Candidatus Cloacimonetes bacterium HGW-Cloacimonetes-3]|jgi:hypothetical protein|nr:MAG: hypothetical protein CVU50_07855 [Candidatus Cloacimonetes bacterium HGW-Cloacimonetes-3]PKN96610.1 MAG: hypothetical protein CVU43_19805 [Chloroflexi bacterium HGW-Chloroflexi-5]